MSDIPESFMKAAEASLSIQPSRAVFPRSDVALLIARALMAADEAADDAATKRERERASSVVDEIAGHYRESSASFKAARVVNGAAISDGIARLLDDVAAILKGEA